MTDDFLALSYVIIDHWYIKYNLSNQSTVLKIEWGVQLKKQTTKQQWSQNESKRLEHHL